MSKSPGLGAGADLLTRRTRPDGATGTGGNAQASFVAQFAGKAQLRVVDVPIDERLADNPENPPKRVEDLDTRETEALQALADNIAEFGLLQPLIVSEAAVYRETNPGAQLDTHTEWVLRVGHRRRAAARLLGMTVLPAIVRTDDAGVIATLGVMLSENVHRKAMTPLQEARMLGTMRDAGGLSQRNLQKATGISQGQISKRLTLLELDPVAQDAIDAGHISVIDALEHLSKLTSDDQARVVELILVRAAAEAPADPDTVAGASASIAALVRQLTRPEEQPPNTGPAAAEPSGTPDIGHGQTAATQEQESAPLDNDGPRSAPASRDPQAGSRNEDSAAVYHPTPDSPPPRSDPEQDDPAHSDTAPLDERAAASQSRMEACQRYVHSNLKPTEVAGILVDAALIPPKSRPSRAIALAATWIGLDITATAEDLAVDLANRGGKQAQRLAVATVLVRREADLAALAGPWDEAARRHVRRLVELGVHELTNYEQQQLDAPLT